MTHGSDITNFVDFLKILDSNGILPHVILMGSWAEYMYMETNVIPDFTTSVRTLDVDFLIKNANMPRNPINVPNIVEKFGCHVKHDYIYGTTKIVTRSLLEIEFLIPQQGSGDKDIIKTNLGINAQPLTHLSILRELAAPVDFQGMMINIPIPEAYVAQKMIVNKKRRPDKAEKDINSILNLLPHLNVEKFNEVTSMLTKKENQEVKKFIEDNDLKWFFDGGIANGFEKHNVIHR